MERKLLSLVLISGFLSGFVAPSVSAAETGTPQAEVKSDQPPDAAGGSSPPDPNAAGGSSPPDPTAATTTVPEPSAAVVKSSKGINPGPLEAERKAMLDNINAAEELGVGVAGYMAAFKFMEEEVAGGATEATVQKRLDSLRKGLTEQLERKQYLKERPAASAAQPAPSGGGGILMPAQEIPPGLRYGGAGGSLASPELAKQLSEKYGSKLPAGMNAETIKSQWQNPQSREMFKEKLKSNPAAMELLKQFLNK